MTTGCLTEFPMSHRDSFMILLIPLSSLNPGFDSDGWLTTQWLPERRMGKAIESGQDHEA